MATNKKAKKAAKASASKPAAAKKAGEQAAGAAKKAGGPQKGTKSTAKKAASSSSSSKSVTSDTKKRAAGKKAAASTSGSSASKSVSASASKTKAGTKAAAGKKTSRKAASKKTVAKNTSATTKRTSGPTKGEPPEIPAGADYLTDKAWLDGQKAALLEQRAKYTHSADRLAAEAAALMADREPGDVQFDEESGEGDTIAVERDRDLALSAAARQAVGEIDAALERLEAGSYGICLVSGEAIPRERLEAIPEASVCVQYKTSMF